MAIIETKNLCKFYDGKHAVKDLTFEVEEGSVFGFIGPNGAGKTTTIKMFSTLLEPSSGEAKIAGYDVVKNYKDVRRIIGYMPDVFGVYEDMKVREYLDFFASCYRIPINSRKKAIDDVLSLTDLVSKTDSYTASLSLGIRQRLCLAKTLLHDPKVLFLDEPATGLDPRARIDLREMLKELKNLGKTIFVSSHILHELSDFCDSVGIIEDGRLVVSGNIDEIGNAVRETRIIHIKVVSESEKAKEIISANPKVEKVTIQEGMLVVELNGDLDDQCCILETLVANRIKISEFNEKAKTLEEVFIKVTKGIIS